MTTSPETPLRVGVIGLGQMGAGIARNLQRTGLLTAVWDAAPAAMVPFQAPGGTTTAQSPRAVAACCDVVIFVVPSSNEIAMCLDGPNGVLSAAAPRQILLDLTTSHPDDTKTLAAQAADAGRAYLDAGMSGGAQSADDGQLTLMCGGEAGAFARCEPAFAAIANMDKVFHVGPSGAGHAMKLVHNMICHTIFLATSEGCRVAERAGIDLATAVNVINKGNARSFVSEVRFPRHILTGQWDARSRVANLEKDLGMGVAMAQSLGAPAAFAAQTHALLQRAMDDGMGEVDFSRLYQAFDRLAE